jgi:proteasome assembly chaperone (PAC2) family protein
LAEGSAVEFWKKPETQELYMLTGFRQWADGGSVSSGLPVYLVQQTGAEPIGRMRPDGFYLFQVPGTHDLMRPVVHYENGFPTSLDTQRNDFYYTGDRSRGLVIFVGDEPNMDAERYVAELLDAARTLGVKRIVSLGGVYGELPYEKERMISCTYSLPGLMTELSSLMVIFSDYQGGASIDSVIGKRAGERNMEHVGLYAFVPAYDFSLVTQAGNTVRIENDFTAWLGIMRRLNYMFHMGVDLLDLENKSAALKDLVRSKVEEIESAAPQLGVREYMEKLAADFTELVFNPLDQVWDDELKRLLNKLDDSEETPPGTDQEM